ncbi:MAG: preprotein translocase subunit SecE [Actinomycetaceae bacterium]|nr:preprotein translocase subunit SecE [Actinomycetaceae bacterium]
MTNAASKAAGKASTERVGFFARIALFVRQVFGELKKVQRPAREELGQMFTTVILFVAVIMVFVGVIDFISGRTTFWIFG